MSHKPLYFKTLLMAACTQGALAAACSDGDGGAPEDTTGGGRPYLMGSWAESYDRFSATSFSTSFAVPTTAADAKGEAVVVSFEDLGLPSDAFSGPSDTPNAPPALWVQTIDQRVAAARADGRTVVLAISPLSTSLDTLAANTTEAGPGILRVDTSWRSTCFDPGRETNPTRLREQFARFAAWLVNRARPDMVIVGHRLNIYEARCGQAPWRGMLDFVGAAISRIRAVADLPSVPGQPVFVVPTIIAGLDVEDLYGLPSKPGRCAGMTIEACLEQRASLLGDFDAALGDAAAPDVVGLDAHPAAFVVARAGEEIPARYLTNVLQKLAERKVAIIATSLPAQSLTSRQGPCVPHYTVDDDAQRRWLDLVLAAGQTRAMPLVVWRNLGDLAKTAVVTSCPCTGDSQLCDDLASVGGAVDALRLRLVSGLVDSDGNARPALATWRAAIASGVPADPATGESR